MNKFELKKQFHSEDLKATVYEYVHSKTKTSHIHIKPLNPFNNENSCCITLRTPPKNSHGTPHVLEHLVLNGSKKFNVKNVFNNMASRSCSTFMNAMTDTDKTLYPFTSENEKDYQNLLQVYLDSVFHANMLEQDYWQEGWRLHFDETTNQLEYKGIVFNEMKGALSNSLREIDLNLKQTLFKDTHYKNYAGGIPSEIVKLTYTEIKDFYDTYYHPSNSIIFTYGPQDIEKTQQLISESLDSFEYKDIIIDESNYLEKEQYINSTKKVQVEHFNSSEENDDHIIFSWFTNDLKNTKESLKMVLLNKMLLAQDCAVQKMCEKKNYLLSDFFGYRTEGRQTFFSIGIHKTNGENVKIIEQDVLQALQEFKEQKFLPERLHNVLNEYEFHMKEQNTRGTPYSTSVVTNLSDIINYPQYLNNEVNVLEIVNELRQEIENPDFLKSIIDNYFGENKLKTTVSKANSKLYEQKEQKEKDELLALEKTLTVQQKQEIIEQNKKIESYQNAVYDYSILPKLQLSDISTKIDPSVYTPSTITNSINFYETQNGISYLNLYFDTPVVKFDAYDSIVKAIYSSYVTENTYISGLNEQESYILKEKHIYDFRINQSNFSNVVNKHITSKIRFSGKNLDINTPQLIATMFKSIFDINFESREKAILKLNEYFNRLENTNNIGQYLVSELVNQDTNASSNLNLYTLTPQYIESIKTYINQILDSSDNVNIFMENLSDYHKQVISSPVFINFIGNKKDLTLISKEIKDRALSVSTHSNLQEMFNSSNEQNTYSKQLNNAQQQLQENDFRNKKVLVVGPTSVGYNYRVFKIDTDDYKVRANFKIACALLDNEVLIPLIREQGGAYGASSQFIDNTFILSSYRDPEFLKTFDNFSKSISLLIDSDISQSMIDNSIISTVGNINSVSNYHKKVTQSFVQDLEQSKHRRDGVFEEILKVNPQSIKETLQKYILNNPNYQDYSYHNENVKDLDKQWETINLLESKKKNNICKNN